MRYHEHKELKGYKDIKIRIIFGFSLALSILMSQASANNPGGENTLLDRIIVTVDEDVILESELQDQVSLIKNQMKHRKLDLPSDNILRKQLLERMILDSIQTQMATRSGIRIDDDQVNQAMSKIAAQQGQSLSGLQQSLVAQGTSYPVFREQIRKELLLTKIQQRRMAQRIQISDLDIQHFLGSTQAQAALSADYHLKHILIALPEKPDLELVKAKEAFVRQLHQELTANPSEFESKAVSYSEGQFALKGGDLGWRSAVQLPGLFLEQVKQLPVGAVSKPFRSPSGFHLLWVQDKRGGSEIFVPQTKVRHILIKPNQIRSDQQSFQLITDLHNRIKANSDFSDLAKTYSDDPGSALNGGSLGWVNLDSLTPKFAQTVKNTAVGERSQPFRSQYGWHILEVLDRREQDMSEDYKKNQATNIIYKRRFTEELQTWLREIRQEAYVEYRI